MGSVVLSRFGVLVATAAAAVLATACTTPGVAQGTPTPAAAQLRVLSSRGDAVSLVARGEAPALVVKRERGIGDATLERAGAAWPEELVVELEGFRDLESFMVCAGERCVETDLRSAPRARVREGREERWTDEVEIPLRVSAGSIRGEVPAAAVAGRVRRLELRWVDQYR